MLLYFFWLRWPLLCWQRRLGWNWALCFSCAADTCLYSPVSLPCCKNGLLMVRAFHLSKRLSLYPLSVHCGQGISLAIKMLLCKLVSCTNHRHRIKIKLQLRWPNTLTFHVFCFLRPGFQSSFSGLDELASLYCNISVCN